MSKSVSQCYDLCNYNHHNLFFVGGGGLSSMFEELSYQTDFAGIAPCYEDASKLQYARPCG